MLYSIPRLYLLAGRQVLQPAPPPRRGKKPYVISILYFSFKVIQKQEFIFHHK